MLMGKTMIGCHYQRSIRPSRSYQGRQTSGASTLRGIEYSGVVIGRSGGEEAWLRKRRVEGGARKAQDF
jgi:hypothetical protein